MNDYKLPKELRISTMTATSKFNSDVNLKNTFNNLNLDDNIIYIEYASDYKGELTTKRKAKKKIFFNQITIKLKLTHIIHNIKLFNNGSISMTGVKSKETGYEAIQILYTKLMAIKDTTIFNNTHPKIEKFKIVLINSDYNIGYLLKRNVLHQLLVNHYNIYSSFEPCIYPGVNSKFFWNKDYKNKEKLGKCYCSNFCNGKGNGIGEQNCKKITISAFQSGSIIITGAQTIEQIIDSFNFINSIFKLHYKELKKDLPDFIVDQSQKKNIIYIEKSKFIESKQIRDNQES